MFSKALTLALVMAAAATVTTGTGASRTARMGEGPVLGAVAQVRLSESGSLLLLAAGCLVAARAGRRMRPE